METFVPSAGTKLFWGDAVSGTYGSVALRVAAMVAAADTEMAPGDVRKWGKMPSSPRAEIDTTPANAVDDDGEDDTHERSAPGWSKPGTLEYTVTLNDALIAELETAKEAGDNHNFMLLYKSGAARVAEGWIMDVAHEIGEKGEVVATITIQMTGRLHYVPAGTFALLLSATVTGAKEVTLQYGGTIASGDFALANTGIIHNGTMTLAGTITAGATNHQVKITAAGFQASPVGDTVFVMGPSYTAPRPATKIVQAA